MIRFVPVLIMRAIISIIIFVCLVYSSHAQRNNIWCFGDSAGIDFNDPANPLAITSSIVNRGSCVSISDTSGNLLFYGSTEANGSIPVSGVVYNRNNAIMQGGDSIAGAGWYEEMVITLNPSDDSLYYLFSVGVTHSFGLVYSIIDMRGDNTLGTVVQRNIPLITGKFVDCVASVKHGNGRDWWIIIRDSPVGQPTFNNIWRLYLISTSGISAMPIQNIGELNSTNAGKIAVSPNGSKLCFTNLGGLIEIFDFNRCTGEITNSIIIEPQSTTSPFPYYWSSEFSPNSQYLYVSSNTLISRLWQFDTWAANITATKTLIWQVQNPANTAGALKRAPNNKIYFSCAWVGGGFNYLNYDSTQYFLENMNIGFINSPDSGGIICDFSPWSFYLGGKRTYWGLPNNPDYDLGPLNGSPCDTIVAINDQQLAASTSDFFVFYSLQWQSAFINVENLKGKNYKLMVMDVMGKQVFSESGSLSSQYFTKNLNCAAFAKGMYIATFITEKEKLSKKFVIE